MILKGTDPQMVNAKIYDAHDQEIALFVKEYNTETQEITFYVPTKTEGSLVSIARTKTPTHHGLGWEGRVIEATIKVEGSYATVNGKRVE